MCLSVETPADSNPGGPGPDRYGAIAFALDAAQHPMAAEALPASPPMAPETIEKVESAPGNGMPARTRRPSVAHD